MKFEDNDRVALLLDLLNTTPIVAQRPTDDLADNGEARAWFADRGVDVRVADLPGLRRLRHSVQNIVRGVRPPADLAEYLDGVTRRPRLSGDILVWELDSASVPLLEVELVLAMTDLAEAMPGRLRPCGNDECRRFLLDRTRAGTARWCSMSACGNRMKARRHHERSAAPHSRD